MRYSIFKGSRLFSLAVSCLLVTACGGGGGGSLAGGGIGGTGITASGTITAFGSIFVNGIEFETGGAHRNVDGELSISDGTDDDTVLGLGMVVTVTGSLNVDGVTGTAESIQYDAAVQGPVQDAPVDVDPVTRRITVMGISVTVHKINTVFENVTFESQQVADLVEVSGFYDATGGLLATRVERKKGNEVEVKGTVSGLASDAFVLAVNHGVTSYTVDAAGAELPAGGLANNMLVEVKGTLAGTAISATRVEAGNEVLDDVEKASIEGVVAGYNSIADFRVDGQQVNAAGAGFSPPSLRGDLENGMEVEVEGPIQGGVLMAGMVEARGGNVELGARVLTVVPDAGGLTGNIALQFIPGSLTVSVDSRTTLRDDTGVKSPLTLADIQADDVLQVTAYRDGAMDPLIATEIRRETTGHDRLEGPVDNCLAGAHVTVLGLSFALVDGMTRYQDEEEQPLADSTAFCASQAVSGSRVEVEDTPVPDGTADTARLED
jgi:hypothetical protein